MDFDSAAVDHFQPVLVTAKGDPWMATGIEHVELDLMKFPSGRWALQLDAAFARRSGPAVILARGVACLAVSWWAQLSPRNYLNAVRGAVFRSPLHFELGQAPIAASASTGPSCRLPFSSIVANDITLCVEQVLALADRWGSGFVDLDAPRSGVPSNRSDIGNRAEEWLLDYLDLFNPQVLPDNSCVITTVSPTALVV